MVQSMSLDTCSNALPLRSLLKDTPGANLDDLLQNHSIPAIIKMVAPNKLV